MSAHTNQVGPARITAARCHRRLCIWNDWTLCMSQHSASRQQSGASSMFVAHTSSDTRKSPSIVMTGVNAFSIWMNATERKR